MKFTKKEIAVCKKIAEKHRKEIKYGDWYLDNIVVLLNNDFIKGTIFVARQVRLGLIPLWQISDCLEFLRERRKHCVFLSHDEGDEKEWWCFFDEYHETQQFDSGKTPLEALLKVVLGVLKNGK